MQRTSALGASAGRPTPNKTNRTKIAPMAKGQAARRCHAPEGSVIADWWRRRRRRRRRLRTCWALGLAATLITLISLAGVIARSAIASPTQAEGALGASLAPHADFLHASFALGDLSDHEDNSNELARTLTRPLSSVVSPAPALAAMPSEPELNDGRAVANEARSPWLPVTGDGRPGDHDDREHHAQLGEARLELRKQANQTVVVAAQGEPQLAGRARSYESNSTSVGSDNQQRLASSSQQVAGPQVGQQLAGADAQHKHGDEQRPPENRGQKTRRNNGKRKQFLSLQTSLDATGAPSSSLVPGNQRYDQMVTYVSQQQQQQQGPMGAHNFERLLGANQQVRFLQPSVFKLALNSALLYKQLHLDGRQPSESVAPNASLGQAAAQAASRAAHAGPFELEQLQATASTGHKEQVSLRPATRERGVELTAASQLLASANGNGSQPLHEAHESAASPELAAAAARSPGIPDHLDEDDDNGSGGGGGGGANEPSGHAPGPQEDDTQTDERGAEAAGQSKESPASGSGQSRQNRGGGGGGGGDSGPTLPLRAAAEEARLSGNKTAPPPQADTSEQAHQARKSPRLAALGGAQTRAPPTAGSTSSLGIASNELLVGPFKSEAEAPATITLAGVVYQKSGASSALVRAAPAHQRQQQQQQHSRQPSGGLAFAASASPATGGLASSGGSGGGDWSSSLLLHNMIESQAPPAGSGGGGGGGGGGTHLYLGPMGAHQFAGAPEQMSLSSSSAEPTRAKLLASQLATGGSEPLIIMATGSHDQPAASSSPQLYQQRLPNGSLIWTLNKPQAAPASSHLQSLLQAAASGAGDPSGPVGSLLPATPGANEMGVSVGGGGGSSSESALESKPHGDEHKHSAPGPIVIVQKDVKPVKYHLMRAYLRLRRLLRPSEATYVFTGDQASAATSASSFAVTGAHLGSGRAFGNSGGSGTFSSGAFLRRRRQPANLNLDENVARAAAAATKRWRARTGLLSGRARRAPTGGRLER